MASGRLKFLSLAVGLAMLVLANVAAAQTNYDFPADCPVFAEQHDQIWDGLRGQADVNWFHRIEAICEQYFPAERSSKTAAHYYILGQLSDQPVFPEAMPQDIAAARAVRIDYESCRLELRQYGEYVDFDRNLLIKKGRAVCVEVPHIDLDSGFGIEISKTLFRDVDGDGYMDALLIVHDNSAGSQGNSETIVVTRKESGHGPLTKVRFQRLWE